MGDSIVFTLARLVPPGLDLAAVTSDRFSFPQDLLHDAAAAALGPGSQADAAAGFAGRVAGAPQPLGGGLLRLPQAFGAVYLGQSFAALITAANGGDGPLASVGIKVELTTERGRAAVLYDSTGQPLNKLEAGQRHDFTVKQDIRELGAHSLVCTATYVTRLGERRTQAQAFNFSTLNPLTVRTKQRQVGEAVLLEATLENATKADMLMDTVQLLAVAPWSAERLGGGGASALPPPVPAAGGAASAAEAAAAAAAAAEANDGPLSAYIQALPLIPPGAASAFLFRLTKPAAAAAAAAAAGSSPRGGVPQPSPTTEPTTLGRIEIKWRGPMGQVARLQTQAISLPPQAPREASLALARLPRRAVVGLPFTATFKVQSHVDRRLGPLQIAPAQEPAAAGTPPPSLGSSPSRTASGVRRAAGSSGSEPPGSASREASLHAAGGVAAAGRSASSASVAAAAAAAAAAEKLALPPLVGVQLEGLQAVVVDELGPRQAVEVQLRLLALAAGQQALPALALSSERDGRLYCTLPPIELFVDSSA